jgi:hypothetical protein
MRVCFLYNHDAGHQVAHSIGIAAELATSQRSIRTVIAYGSATIRAEIEKHLTAAQIAALEWLDLDLSPLANALLALPNRLAPARRMARLLAGAKLLRGFDMIVST